MGKWPFSRLMPASLTQAPGISSASCGTQSGKCHKLAYRRAGAFVGAKRLTFFRKDKARHRVCGTRKAAQKFAATVFLLPLFSRQTRLLHSMIKVASSTSQTVNHLGSKSRGRVSRAWISPARSYRATARCGLFPMLRGRCGSEKGPLKQLRLDLDSPLVFAQWNMAGLLQNTWRSIGWALHCVFGAVVQCSHELILAMQTSFEPQTRLMNTHILRTLLI